MNFDSSTGYKVSLSKLFNQPVLLMLSNQNEDIRSLFETNLGTGLSYLILVISSMHAKMNK